MIEDSQNLNNVENKEEIINKPPKSQKKLVIILLSSVIILLGTVIYFLIKDEIIQIPFLNTKQENLEIVNDNTTEEEYTEDEVSRDENEEDRDSEDLEDTVEKDETEDVDTSDWLTYQLDNPKLSFKYPNGLTVSLVPTNDEQFVHLQISGARESFNYYMFYGEGGPGVGTSGEIESPESITMIGEFLGGDIYEIKNGEFYKYFSYIEKCSTCLAQEGYSPGCPCTSAENYTYNSMFNRKLRWDSVGVRETFIEIEVKWTMSDYDRSIYEYILLSFEEI